MKRDFWLQLMDSALAGIQWGALLALACLALIALSELTAYTQATYALMREMRSDVRSRLPLVAEKETE